MGTQLSLKAVLPLAESLATAPDRCSNTRPRTPIGPGWMSVLVLFPTWMGPLIFDCTFLKCYCFCKGIVGGLRAKNVEWLWRPCYDIFTGTYVEYCLDKWYIKCSTGNGITKLITYSQRLFNYVIAKIHHKCTEKVRFLSHNTITGAELSGAS